MTMLVVNRRLIFAATSLREAILPVVDDGQEVVGVE